MPVREVIPKRSTDHQEFVSELSTEWSKPNPTAVEPAIYLERDRDGRVAHVYVLWEKWASVDRTERSEIVMDAAEKVLPKDDVLNISIAMGLTAEEADRLGLRF